MYKKLFAIITILIIGIFSFSVSLAAENNILQDGVDGIRDAVGGAENAIEDGARDISNTAKEATGNAENGASNVMGSMNNNDDTTIGRSNDNANQYRATRTSADTGTTFMGMNSTAWTWLIIGIAGIAIIALVWYYGTQLNNSDSGNMD